MTMAAIPLSFSTPHQISARDWTAGLKRTLSFWLFKEVPSSDDSAFQDQAPISPAPQVAAEEVETDLSSVLLAIQNKPPSLAVRRSQRKIQICPPPFSSDIDDETVRIDSLQPSPSLQIQEKPLTPVQSALARRKELKQLQLKDLAIQARSPRHSSASVEEYVQRQRLAKCTGNRDQRFPVAGNNMRPICVGSGYAYAYS